MRNSAENRTLRVVVNGCIAFGLLTGCDSNYVKEGELGVTIRPGTSKRVGYSGDCEYPEGTIFRSKRVAQVYKDGRPISGGYAGYVPLTDDDGEEACIYKMDDVKPYTGEESAINDWVPPIPTQKK